MKKLSEELKGRILIFDGALGTMLQQSGYKGVPEKANLESPELVRNIHLQYVNAGSDMINTNTFGANRVKLANYSMESRVQEINQKAVELARSAVISSGEGCIIAGSVGPTGELMKPYGPLDFDKALECFREQISSLKEADVINIETMSSIHEAKAAVIAAKEYSLPVICSMIFEENDRTTFGTDARSMITILESLGIDVIGTNCGFLPEKLSKIVDELCKYSRLPILVKPNAGLPSSDSSYSVGKEAFAATVMGFVERGASIVGGCCGTTPEYISKLKEIIGERKPAQRDVETLHLVSNGIYSTELKGIIGEDINPTRKKKLKEALKKNELSLVEEMADLQIEHTKILDINMGMAGIDMEKMMSDAVNVLCPKAALCIDSSDIKVIEAGLKAYQGKAIINSTTASEESMEKIFSLAKKYGSAVIALAMSNEMPKDLEQRVENAERIMQFGSKYILPKDILVDFLVETVAVNQQAPSIVLGAIEEGKKRGMKTILGVSNVSHGLPNRALLNKAFAEMAFAQGLDMVIASPKQLNEPYPNEDMEFAREVLMGKRPITEYVERFSNKQMADAVQNESAESKIHAAVIRGNKQGIAGLIEAGMNEGLEPKQILNNILIPAITKCGNLFESGKFFLPQLMLSAESMEAGVNFLQKYMADEAKQSRGTIVLATVKGDVHDIGKNIVSYYLKNNGYNIIDLGKDVTSERIVEEAVKNKADFIGASALMTTTMKEMENLASIISKERVDAKLIVGGAVIDKIFAKSIGALYGKNPVDAFNKLEAYKAMAAECAR